ncbi:DUF2516 family protein [Sinomonas halotolerans]|uniref:DUF2516 family protein n=1 Tax=Sinomonas halotolerans TaxID=1644133 RepID=A0ABU9X0D4_9MICC
MDGKMMIFWIQFGVGWAVTVLCAGLSVWAFVDCLTRKGPAFEANSKRTKGFWLGLTGAAAAFTVFGILTGPMGPTWGLGLFNIAAVTAAGVYLADVRPAVASR